MNSTLKLEIGNEKIEIEHNSLNNAIFQAESIFNSTNENISITILEPILV